MAVTHFSGPVAVGSGKFETVTAGKTLTMKDDNGKTFVLGDAASGNITLPAVTNTGFHCKVICGFNITTNSILSSAEGDNMEGAMMVASTVVDVDNVDAINFVNTADNIGDWVSVFSDGTYWYVDGRALATGALTTTDA
jgi:hypothetical protein